MEPAFTPPDGSCTREPVFIVLSQSAATAAVMAVETKVAMQRVDCAKLRVRLLADGQVLDWPLGPAQRNWPIDSVQFLA